MKLPEVREGTNYGYVVDDVAVLIYLAQKILRGVKSSFGDQGELTREVAYMHRVLKRLRRELGTSDSFLNNAEDDLRQDITELGNGCMRILMRTEDVLARYNSLPEGKKTVKRPWSKSKPLSAEMQELSEIKRTLSAHTSAMTVCLDLCSSRGQGRVEKQLRNLAELRGIPEMTSKFAAEMTAKTSDGTVWTLYKEDDSAFWKKLRRRLVKNGFGSHVLEKHEDLIKEYVEELGRRGVFDQSGPAPGNDSSTHDINVDGRVDEMDTESAKVESNGSMMFRLSSEEKEQDAELSESRNVTFLDPESDINLSDVVSRSTVTSSEPCKFESPFLAAEKDMYGPVVGEGIIKRPASVPDITSAAKRSEIQIVEVSIPPRTVQIEEVVDEEFLPGAHQKVGDPPKPVQLEEIKDEEFQPGVHPCLPNAKYWNPINRSAESTPISLTNVLRDRGLGSRKRQTFWEVAEQMRLKSKARYDAAKAWSKYQIHTDDESDANEEEAGYEDEDEGSEEESYLIEDWRSYTPNYVFFSTKTLDPDVRKPRPIILRDAVGREFTFPFHMCSTWEVPKRYHEKIKNW